MVKERHRFRAALTVALSGLILFVQVNAYDSVRVVDALYRSKYFLTSTSGFSQDCSTPSLTKILSRNYDSQVQPENHDIDDANSGGDIRMNGNNVHKVTILNLPEDVSEPLDETQTGDLHEVCMQGDDMARRNNEDESYICSSTELCTPILPWINGDGTVNSFVYNGLLRRVFGTVMQNPGILEVHAFPNAFGSFIVSLNIAF